MRRISDIPHDRVTVAPSLLAADFSRLADEVKRVETAGADLLHLDVMDGHFVPNISFGAPVVKALRPVTGLFFDAHLMISDPVRYAPDFVEAGAELVTFHVESVENPARAVAEIRRLGCAVGISIKPNTPAESVFELLDKVELVLIMSVEPGFGGQSFMPESLAKIAAVRREATRRKLTLHVEVDGGIDERTAPSVVAAGANMLVAGTAVFRHPAGAREAVLRLRNAQNGEM